MAKPDWPAFYLHQRSKSVKKPMPGIASYVEPVLHQVFGRVGAVCAKYPQAVLTVVLVLAAALSVGNGIKRTEFEPNELLIARRGRIAGESDFFEDNFEDISPLVNSVIVTPKEGVYIFSVEALDELYALQEHIRTFTFEYNGRNVSMEQFCFKAVNAQPNEPCWQSSILDSFREGAVFNVGGEKNSEMAFLYASKPSYRDFDFSTLSRSFLAATNVNPDSLLLGNMQVDPEDMNTITGADALQVAFSAKPPAVLVEDGLQYFTWIPVQLEQTDAGFCPDATQCEVCADLLQPTALLGPGCTFDGAPSQPAECCAFMEAVRASPCVETVFERRTEFAPFANPIFAACGLDTVELAQRCQNLDLIVGSDLQITEAAAGLNDAAAEAPAADAVPSGIQPDVAGLGGLEAAEVPTIYTYEVETVKDLTETLTEARRLNHAWEKAWRAQIEDVVSKYKYINVVYLTSTSLYDTVEETAEADFALLFSGYIVVFLYIALVTSLERGLTGVKLSHLPPGPGTSLVCYIMLIIGVISTLGAAGYVSRYTNYEYSLGTVVTIPLLLVGLGINDFFVLVVSLKSVMKRADCPPTAEGIMFETMSIAGTSITLSSATNLTAFALSALCPVPIILFFAVQMSIGTIISYLMSLTAIPCLVSISVRRYLDGKDDILLQLLRLKPTRPVSKVAEAQMETASEGVLTLFVRKYKWPIAISILSAFVAWMTVGSIYLADFKQGIEVSKGVNKNSYVYDFLKTSEENFDTFQLNIVFRTSVNYSDPEDFGDARKSEYEYVDEGHQTEKQLTATSWMEFYTQYVEAKVCSNEICLNEVEFYYDGFSSPEYGLPTKNICAGAGAQSESACRQICAAYCAQGPADSEFRCQYVESSNECYCPWRPMLKPQFFYENPEGYDGKVDSYWSDFLTATPTGRASSILINFDDGTVTEKNLKGIPRATRSLVFARGLDDVPDQIDHLEKGRDILDGQDIDVYPFDYLVYGQGERYVDLALQCVRGVGISMAVALVVMLPLTINIFTNFLVVISVICAVLLTAGTITWTSVNFDFQTFVSLIITVGLSIEFHVHLARAFMLTDGDRLSRALHAVRTYGVAGFHGATTTFLGVLPTAFSDEPTFFDRTFVQYAVIVACGLFMGLFVFPVVLTLVGPPSYVKNDDTNDDAKTEEKTEAQNSKEEA